MNDNGYLQADAKSYVVYVVFERVFVGCFVGYSVMKVLKRSGKGDAALYASFMDALQFSWLPMSRVWLATKVCLLSDVVCGTKYVGYLEL